MRDVRQKLVGMVLLFCGMVLLTNGGGRLLAEDPPNPNPTAKCNGYEESSLTQPCKDEVMVCNGQSEAVCKSYSIIYTHVETFPDVCNVKAKKLCNKVLTNCYRTVGCKWQEDKTTPANSKCVEVTYPDTVWTSKARPTNQPCIDGEPG